MKDTFKIKWIDIEKLNPAKYNPRQDLQPNDAEYIKIQKSINEFGLVDPLVVNKDNTIIGGHQRFKVLVEAGFKKVPCSIVDLSKDKEKALNIALNKISGDWDLPKLKDILLELDTGDFDMEIVGFDEVALEDLMTQFHVPEEGLTEDDTIPEDIDPISKTGDLWLLGKHRVLCGDATKKEDVERLMDGKKADMVFTDPPYGISIVSGKGKIGGGKLCDTGTYKAIINDDTTETAQKMYEVALKIGVEKFIIFGGNYFTGFLSPSSCWIIWDKKGEMNKNNFTDCEMIWTNFNKPARIITHLWRGMIKQGESDKRVHPTQKPIDLLVKIIEEYTQPDDIILDPFLGSGSTLIACEKTAQICYGMEIDPYYIDVIIKRWEGYVGEKAVLDE